MIVSGTIEKFSFYLGRGKKYLYSLGHANFLDTLVPRNRDFRHNLHHPIISLVFFTLNRECLPVQSLS